MDVKTDIKRAKDYFESENLSRAKRTCERILSSDSKHAEAHALLGLIEMQRVRFAYAIPHLEKAVALEPENVDFLVSLGLSYQKERQVLKAYDAYTRALEIDPKNYRALYGIGGCLIPMGETDKAQKNLEKAISISNELMEPYRLLASFTSKGSDKKFYTQMAKLENEVKGKPTAEQVQWHYAMASACEKLEKKEEFSRHLQTASSLQPQAGENWLPAHKFMLDKSEDAYSNDPFALVTPDSEKLTTPIFIVGMPRSGSTMVEQILASHEKVFGADELLYLRRFFIEDMSRHVGKPYPLFIPELEMEDMVGLAQKYQQALVKMADGQPYVTDKMVGNIFFVGMIRKVMPWAKVIHIKRHPYDMALSIYSRYFDASTSFLNNLDEMADYFICQYKAANFWEKICPEFVHKVRYEDLVNDLERESRKIFEFCDLEWDPKCLDFHKTDRSVFTHSTGQVRKAVYTSSINQWKDYENILYPFINKVQTILSDYGYDS